MILRRMPDYVHYICPQFTETDINFQRVPIGRHLEPVHRPLDPDRRRIDGRHPLRATRAASTSPTCSR